MVERPGPGPGIGSTVRLGYLPKRNLLCKRESFTMKKKNKFVRGSGPAPLYSSETFVAFQSQLRSILKLQT